MATMDAGQVTVGSAKATGAIWVAPKGTTLPTNATTALPSTWKLLGFTSDAGVQISESSNTQDIVAWEERTVVYTVRTEYKETVTFTPIQSNSDVAALIWGSDNVIVSSGNITTKHHGQTLDPVCIVIETTPRVGIVKRYCGTFQLTERGEQVMNGTQIDARTLSFQSLADSNGVTLYEYQAGTSATRGVTDGETRGETKGAEGDEINDEVNDGDKGADDTTEEPPKDTKGK